MKPRVPLVDVFDAARLNTQALKDRPLKSFRIANKAGLVLIARALLANHMDFAATVKMLFPRDTPARLDETQEYLESNKELALEVEEQLKIPGLDETSKTAYVREMWLWLWHPTDNELKTAAARILAKAFMPEKVDDKPVELKITGLEAGLKKMGLGAEVASPDAAELTAPTEDILN